MQGSGSSLRFFAITNKEQAVGFFANRNHFAAQLYVGLAFVGVWLASSINRLIQSRSFHTSATLSLAGAVGFLLVLTAGLAMARSRAGILIAMVVLCGVGTMALVSRDACAGRATRLRIRTVLTILSFSLLLTLQFGLTQIISRFQTEVADDLRWSLNLATSSAVVSALPLGTGLGSFPRVYGVIEDPRASFSAYVNRAHNDLAELLLESGVLGLALIVLFSVWFIRRAIACWSAQPPGTDELYVSLQRAASLAIGGMLIHSLVDYGLRTTSLSTLFAFACGLLTRPPAGIQGGSRRPYTPDKRTRQRPRPVRDDAAKDAPASPQPPPAWVAPAAGWPVGWTSPPARSSSE